MAVIKNFKPMGGKHCITNALKQIFYFYGHPISEEMLFGIGAGLGFTYLNMARAPMVSGRTKPFEFEEKIAKRFHIEIKCKKSKEYSVAVQKTKQFLDKSQPVLVYVDMPYMRYLNLDENSHFGGHAVVIFGYDDQRECFYVSDRDNSDYPIRTPKGDISADYHLVSYAEIKQARSSNCRPFPANNKYLTIDFTGFKPIAPEIVVESIHETCENMLHPPAKLLGLSGIEKFSKGVLKWQKFDSEKRKLAGVTNYFMVSADGGTGGGIFRRMYGEFLIEASEILNNKRVFQLGERYIAVSKQWDDIGKLLWDLSLTGDKGPLETMANTLKEIYEGEKDILEQLLQVKV